MSRLLAGRIVFAMTKLSIAVGALMLVAAIGFHLLMPATAYEIKIKAVKYALPNVQKNTGIKRLFFKTIVGVSRALPSMDIIEINRTDDQIGTDVVQILPYLSSDNTLRVSNTLQLKAALATATQGTMILVANGSYDMPHRFYVTGNAGTLAQPIILKGETSGKVTFRLTNVEGILINKPHWIIENINFMGACDFDATCEHAIHIVGDADNVIIQNNTFNNFNAHIKSNGLTENGVRRFPDKVKILKNNLVNDWIRDTSLSVTPIDVVGGDDWLIQGNFIADIGKRRGNQVTYGAFLKGEGERGRILDNFVVCSWKLPHFSELDVRIGLSLGGGGTGDMFCKGGSCNFEHKDGIIDRNVVANCQNDVAMYINESPNSTITNNYLLGTLGVDVRFANSSAVFENNTIQGRIKLRNKATATFQNNEIMW